MEISNEKSAVGYVKEDDGDVFLLHVRFVDGAEDERIFDKKNLPEKQEGETDFF